jgi:hypothetical protein
MSNIRHYAGGIDFSKPRNRQCLRFSTSATSGTSSQIRADYGHDQHMLKYFPMNIKFIAVMVSKGGTFSGWDNYVSNNGADKQPPRGHYAKVTGEKEIGITFNEYVGDGALSAGSYTLDNGATVSSVKYGFDHTQVLLATSSLDASKTYKLQLSGIKDEAASPNTITATSISLDAKPASAYTIHQAELYDHCNKVVRIPGHVYSVVNNYGKESDEYFRIANLDFGDGAMECRMRGLSDKGASPAKVEIRLDSPTGTKIAEVGFPKEKDHTFKYVTLSSAISENVTGVHDIYVMMKSQMGLGGVDWVQFVSKDGTTGIAPRRISATICAATQCSPAVPYSLRGQRLKSSSRGDARCRVMIVRDSSGKIRKAIAGMK